MKIERVGKRTEQDQTVFHQMCAALGRQEKCSSIQGIYDSLRESRELFLLFLCGITHKSIMPFAPHEHSTSTSTNHFNCHTSLMKAKALFYCYGSSRLASSLPFNVFTPK